MKLKQSDRAKMLADILRDTFAERFQKMHDAINEEFKEYVPEIPPTKNLPVVMVGELRGQLSALGIPAE